MYILITKYARKNNYISGIFKDKTDAENYFNVIPKSLRKNQEIREERVKYPFYILETKSGKYNNFTFHQEDFMINLKKGETLFKIKGDWKPLQAGLNMMGMLEHDHKE